MKNKFFTHAHYQMNCTLINALIMALQYSINEYHCFRFKKDKVSRHLASGYLRETRANIRELNRLNGCRLYRFDYTKKEYYIEQKKRVYDYIQSNVS